MSKSVRIWNKVRLFLRMKNFYESNGDSILHRSIFIWKESILEVFKWTALAFKFLPLKLFYHIRVSEDKRVEFKRAAAVSSSYLRSYCVKLNLFCCQGSELNYPPGNQIRTKGKFQHDEIEKAINQRSLFNCTLKFCLTPVFLMRLDEFPIRINGKFWCS